MEEFGSLFLNDLILDVEILGVGFNERFGQVNVLLMSIIVLVFGLVVLFCEVVQVGGE